MEAGFFVNVAATATRDNYREIPKIIDLCEERGVTWFMVYNFVPTGRGALIADHDLTPEEREDLLNLLWERSRDSGTVEVLSMAPQFDCGGCRARAYAYTGDYLAADPGCVRNADR